MRPLYYGSPFLYRHYYTASTGIVMGMVHIKTDTSIEAMRESGRVVARILARAQEVAAIGVTPRELDEAAREVLREAGASSPFLDYKPHFAPTPFPAVICVSVNDAVVHGIPPPNRCATATWSAWTRAPSSAAGRATRRSASRSARPAPPTRS